MDSANGAYRVTTRSSTYEIDLDRMVLRRFPRTGNCDGSLLRRDDELIMLLAIDDCTVGRRMSLRIDLNVLGVPFTARYATEVVSIKRISSPETKTRL
ncbi:MAG: hypothetical protein WED09_13795 [Homoserinimonas sp.]